MADTAIVTGAASGLGAVIARTLARAGSRVVVADRDAVAAGELLDELERAGLAATFVQTDVSEADQVRDLVKGAVTLGRLTVLVNNAGGWTAGSQFPDTDDWGRTLDLNLRMPMLATQLCLPLMSAGGAVVNVSSSGGSDRGAYGSPEYAVAKAGLIRFTTAVSDFADRYRVRVSCVVPHWIGLDRAVRQYEAMSHEERERSGGLVAPQVVADPLSAGHVVMRDPAVRLFPTTPPLPTPRPGPDGQRVPLTVDGAVRCPGRTST